MFKLAKSGLFSSFVARVRCLAKGLHNVLRLIFVGGWGDVCCFESVLWSPQF